MTKKICLGLIVIAVALLSIPFTPRPGAADAPAIRCAGCSTEYFLIKELAQSYREKTGNIVMPGANNNREGLQLLLEGKVDFAFLCDKLETLVVKLQIPPEKVSQLLSLEIAIEPIIVVAHRDLPVESLTPEQLRAIFFGPAANWQEFGGPDLAIKALSLAGSEESGLATVVREQLLQKAGNKDWATLPWGENVQTFSLTGTPQRLSALDQMSFHIATTPGSVTYFGYNAFRKPFGRIIKVNDVLPSQENIHNGSYPLAARYFIAYSSLKKDKIQDFIKFIRSEQGQALINLNYVAAEPSQNRKGSRSDSR